MQRTALRVVIVSPSDVASERDSASRVIAETSRILALQKNAYLECWRWEVDSHPGFHAEGPQGLIDDLMQIQDADLVVGIFWKRFGTPTTTHASGTEHELSRAIAAYRQKGRPQVMVYFSAAPAKLQSVAESEQWGAVLQFKERFQAAGGLGCSYENADDFERRFRGHLQTYFFAKKESAVATADNNSLLEPPEPYDAVPRQQVWNALDLALRQHPVAVLGGLSGSGKTYVAASYLSSEPGASRYSKVFWHDPVAGESVDNLIAVLGQSVSLAGEATMSRCKSLAVELRNRNGLLVVDNFHLVDQSSYSLLLSAVSNIAGPCRLLLLSQAYVTGYESALGPHHIYLPGLTAEEAESLLSKKGLALERITIDEILEKTGGLPFAVALFSLLVLDFGHEPHELLAGSMENASRIRAWFDKILQSLDQDAHSLLSYLAMLDIPFNLGVVKALGRGLAMPNVTECFESLKRKFLVSQHTPYRWIVHELLRVLAQPQLAVESRTRVHGILGEHFLRGLPRSPNAIVTADQFLLKVRAFRHLIKSSANHEQAAAVLGELSVMAKSRGHYGLLIELSATFIRSVGIATAPWIAYHHGHCALILGQPAYCRHLVEPLLYHPEVVASPPVRLSLTRLYAEALGSLNQPEAAIDALSKAMKAAPETGRAKVPYAQAKSALSWLLTRQGSYAKASQLAHELLVDAQRRGDVRGEAAASALIGTVQLRTGLLKEALTSMRLSADLFEKAQDRRGAVWALSSAGECHLRLGAFGAAEQSIRSAAVIAAEIGACTIDLREYLDRVLALSPPASIELLVREEQERMRRQIAVKLSFLEH